MKILYISTLCSPKVLDKLFNTAIIKPGQAVQKFHRLLVEGFLKYPELCTVDILSTLPVTTQSHSNKWWCINKEIWKGASIEYIPFLNFFIFKHFFVFIFSFFNVIKWRIRNRNEPRIIICDILNNVMVWSTFIACKLTSQKMIVLVTDLPEMMTGSNKKRNIFSKVLVSLSMYFLHRFDYYIILTEQMNAVVNPNNKPFLVMEGLVDDNIKKDIEIYQKDPKRILLYAGGIYRKYGIENLIQAFLQIEDENLELHIYGSGDLENKLPVYCKKDSRIKYFGVVNNTVVVEKLKKATILINPRPTLEEYTKYSFPSKNMEYMVSGTPLLTTKLPGMPSEYNEFVYLIEVETVDGMVHTIRQLLSKSDAELNRFGDSAQQFVLENKSNIIQAQRILEWII